MQNDGFDSADRVAQWLVNNQILFTREQTFVGLMGDYEMLRMDLWLPEFCTCIEVDGQQHYQARRNDSIADFLRKRDYGRRKEFYCLQHGIRLIRIVWDELEYLDRTLGFLLVERQTNSPWYKGSKNS